MRRLLTLTLATVATLGTWLAPASAEAFCGFFVGQVDAALGNRATSVVLMRDGTRTVLSMRNDYSGPPADFAMIVPVPVVLRAGDVKTLPHDIFDRLEQTTAPRLVEYWEEDPCTPSKGARIAGTSGAESRYTVDYGTVPSQGVRVEARFQTGEYDVEVLSARDSLGLASWLRASGYKLPPGADEALRPYVQAGMKFFAAKVAIARTRRDASGRVTLSPLRFHYESDSFSLPIRLGLLNNVGVQDLIVHVIGDRRYQAANRPNLAIPTNLDVTPATSGAFSQFYAALFDRTVQASPGAVVTEHAWTLGVKCDPCTAPASDATALMTLGGDVLWTPRRERTLPLEPNKTPTGAVDVPDDDPFQPTAQRAEREAASRKIVGELRWPGTLVVTRLHLRYGAADPGEDLVLQPAPPIAGGEEGEGTPRLQGPRRSGNNRFQARYAIRHAWDGPIRCAFPWRGRWGGAPPISGQSLAANTPKIAADLAFVARDAALTTFLVGEPPPAEPLQAQPPPVVTPPPTGPTRCDTGGGGLLGLLLLRRRRRR